MPIKLEVEHSVLILILAVMNLKKKKKVFVCDFLNLWISFNALGVQKLI